MTARTHNDDVNVSSWPAGKRAKISVEYTGQNRFELNRIESNRIESNRNESNRIESNRIILKIVPNFIRIGTNFRSLYASLTKRYCSTDHHQILSREATICSK
jgi:hypothetical protein